MPISESPNSDLDAIERVQEKTDAMKFAVVIPTYGNAGTVGEVVRLSSEYAEHVIAVDDGSADGTGDALAALKTEVGRLEVLTNGRNMGKGFSLRVGIERARALGATHVVTIDADGQHSPSDIPKLIEAARMDPEAIVLGAREREIDGYPAHCRIGRSIANWALFVQCFARVSDSQCGMRIYPMGALGPFRFAAKRYSFETELMVHGVWAGRRLVEVPIRCVYPAQRISHWRPWMDSVRETLVQIRLLAIGLVPRPGAVGTTSREKKGMGSRVRGWVSPVRLWREMRRDDTGAARTATGVATGVFIGVTPLFGFHTMLCVYAAWRLRLHPVAVVLGSQIGIPLLAVPIAAASIHVGHFVRGGTGTVGLPDDTVNFWGWFGQIGLDWALGSVIVGAALSLVSYGIVLLLCRPLSSSRGAGAGQE